eukprot:CAMPEP_0171046944 /NCGR_PEP_ID=MMETSP0736-20130129/49903_1 /TAXON_ID=186038 /ORGANISM="Fragilariopsis kerguelensis, Strain L26-C5" /LENGTH=1007 /DNA_ID=CAMNT_0011498215 /DNA_START=375 /DNA_END=3398 /DNA_ORIENTATION=-
MASFLSVKLLEKVMIEAMKEDGESKIDPEVIQQLAEVMKSRPTAETQQAKREELKTIKKSKSNGVGDDVDNVELDRLGTTIKETTATKQYSSTRLGTTIKETTAAKQYSSTPVNNIQLNPRAVDPEDNVDVSIGKKNTNRMSSQILDPDLVSATRIGRPLEIIASDVPPLRPSSIPLERKKAEELFQRRLLKKKLELDALDKFKKNKDPSLKGIISDEISLSSMKIATPETLSASMDDTAQSSNQLERKKAVEFFQRRLLKKKLEFDALDGFNNDEELSLKGITSDEISLTSVKVATPETFSVSMDDTAQSSYTIDTANILERKKSEELFQRRLLKKKLEFDVLDRFKNDKEVSLKGIISDETSLSSVKVSTQEILTASMNVAKQSFNKIKTTNILDKNKVEELFQRRLLKKKLEFDALDRFKTDEGLSLKGVISDEISLSSVKVITQETLSASMDIATQSFNKIDTTNMLESKKAEELFQRSLLKKKLEFDTLDKLKNDEFSSRNVVISDETIPSSTKVTFTSELGTEENGSSSNSIVSERIHILKENVEGTEQPKKVSDSTTLALLENCAVEEVIKKGKESSSSTNSSSKELSVPLPTATIQEHFSKAAKVSHSFVTREFRPAWFATNCHFQTIIGALYRTECMYSRSISVLLDLSGVKKKSDKSLPINKFSWDKRERMKTPDGDFFDVDWSIADNKDDDNPVCLICHGLESCSDSAIAQEIAIACNDVNIDAACINFRGCSNKGEECNLTTRGYHMGFTDDLMQQITKIHSNNPKRRIYLSGFSLGAGVVTKLLANLGEDAYRYNICGAAVNAVPFDASQCATNLNGNGITRKIYGNRLVESMKERIKQQYDNSCGFPFERTAIDECKTIMDIENLVIAPIFGFDDAWDYYDNDSTLLFLIFIIFDIGIDDAWDYYDKVKTIDLLDKICVPEFVIQAKDDPFFKGLEYLANNVNSPLRVQYTELGGHCGYVCQTINEDDSQISWMPTQLGRFFSHVEERYKYAK